MKQIILIAIVILISSCSNAMTDSPELSRAALTDTGTKSLLLVGDSRVAGWPTGFFPGWNVINIGVNGWTSNNVAVQLMNLPFHVNTIIISVGINDMGNGMSLYDSINALSACVGWAKLKADTVYITTVPGLCTPSAIPINILQDNIYRAAQINTFIYIIANNLGVVCIDVASIMNAPYATWYLNPALSYDGTHYNAAGYDAIAELYESYIGGE